MQMKRRYTQLVYVAALMMAGSTLAASAQAQEPELTLPEKNEQKINNLELSLGKMGQLKLSGYVQGQWQWAEQPGIAAFGDGGSFNSSTNNRFMIRRGRIKFTYQLGIVQAVIQPDFTEKGVGIKDVYINVTSKSKVIGGQVGVFDRPFGYEISYSSSLRESPERSRVFLSLFPGERDLGAMAILKGRSGWLADFTLNAGLFNGNGIGVETDSQKDFIGRLAYLKKFSRAQLGAAVSYYNGGVLSATTTRYKFEQGVGYVANTVPGGYVSRRVYTGVGIQYLQQWGAGTTNIRAEFVGGRQPGIQKSNAMPGGTSFAANAPTSDIYLRDFVGYYAILCQDIGRSKHSVVLKYDYYDPNTKVSGNEIGKLQGTGAADIAYSTFGVGYLFRWNQNIRLMAYYDMVYNEKSESMKTDNPLTNYAARIKQNVLTLRVQVKF